MSSIYLYLVITDNLDVWPFLSEHMSIDRARTGDSGELFLSTMIWIKMFGQELPVRVTEIQELQMCLSFHEVQRGITSRRKPEYTILWFESIHFDSNQPAGICTYSAEESTD